MTEKQILASELFYKGYNCAQAVAGAFADELGMRQEELIAMSSAFGGGFARTRNLCGAVSGMGLVISLSMNKTAPDDKGEVYATVREYTDRFIAEFSTLNCGELLKNVSGITSHPQPDERTAQYYKKRPCTAFVAYAAGLLEEYFAKR
ncbi:MAG: C_GCAxxG_C_C family protein [Clostridia bacterium]|nr:C_GCAxxG_C_C family protein [Clostridia bacterium]